MGVLVAVWRRRREPDCGWASRLDDEPAEDGEAWKGAGRRCCSGEGCGWGSSASSGVEGEGGVISYGKGTSREARKRPTLVQCSFSTRNNVHMPLRQTSEKPTKKLRSAECCSSPEKMA